MFKSNNHRPVSHSTISVERETFPPYLVEVDTGEEVLMMEEDDRYRGVPASAYSLENQLKEGVELTQCPTYIQFEGVYGADVATRLAAKFHDMVENDKINLERQRLLAGAPVAPAAPSAPAAAAD